MLSYRIAKMNTTIETEVNYLDQSVESSLYRNGKVYTFRDTDGNDSNWYGAKLTPQKVVINDAREKNHTIDANGFELINAPLLKENLDFLDLNDVVKNYYPQCEDILKKATHASEVYAFDHNIRWKSANEQQTQITDGQQIQQPIYVMHGDYTISSVEDRIYALGKPLGDNDTLKKFLEPGAALIPHDVISKIFDEKKRFSIINVWRNIDKLPVQRDPLGLCDGKSISYDDLVVFEINYKDRIGENYFAKHSSKHEWWYFPQATPDEAILLKQWDSIGVMATNPTSTSMYKNDNRGKDNSVCNFSLHGAFKDPNSHVDSPERRSIEVRCVVFYDD